MSILQKVAQEISPDLPGMPWEDLENHLGMPREEIVRHVLESGDRTKEGFFLYTKILQDKYAQFEAVLNQLVLTFQVEDNPGTSQDEVLLAVAAWKSVEKEVLDVGAATLRALKAKVPTLDQSLILEQEKFRATISQTQLGCLYGVVVHSKGTMQISKIAPEDIVESADNLMKTMNGIIKLWYLGAFNTLKRQSATDPAVGALPIVPAIVIAVSATAAVGIIAWCIVAMTKQTAVNLHMRAICEDAITRDDIKAKKDCIELLKINAVSTDGGPLAQLTEGISTIGKALLLAGIGYALFKFSKPVASLFERKQS